MKARPQKKRPGRKPKNTSALPRSPRCRDCRFRATSGACLDPVLTSGRCGDYIRYVRGNKQFRRLYAKPANPRTPEQRRWRDRFGDASRRYSHSLTDEQRDACVAQGAKLKSRPRMRSSGRLTGQQYSIRKDYAARADVKKQKKRPTAKVPQLQLVTGKYKSQLLQPQRFTRSTPGTRRGMSRLLPGLHQRNTGRRIRHEGRPMHAEGRRLTRRPSAAVRRPQQVALLARQRHRSGRWAKRRQIGLTPGRYPASRRASVLASLRPI
jgi:hypothetical protein